MRMLSSLLMFMIVTLLLRSTALTALAARSVVLDVLAFATVLWALRYGESWGTVFGFALGLAADLDAAHWLGRHALVMSLLGYVVGRLSHTLVRDSARTHLVLLLIATAVHQAWAAVFEFGGVGAWPSLLLRVVLAAVATPLVGTVFLWIVRRVSGPSFFHAAFATGSSS